MEGRGRIFMEERGGEGREEILKNSFWFDEGKGVIV